MAVIENERDKILQAASVRVEPIPIPIDRIDGLPDILDNLTGANRGVRITAPTTIFGLAENGTTTPTSIQLTAEKRLLTGTVTWTVIAGTGSVSPTTGDTTTVTGANMSSNALTIRARITENGTNYDSLVTLIKVLDGSTGERGSITLYATLANVQDYPSRPSGQAPWSNGANNAANATSADTTARNAVWQALGNSGSAPNNNHMRIGDTVTLTNTAKTVSVVGYWGGSSWLNPGTVINGNLLVGGSVSADKINSRGLSIYTPSGQLVIDAGRTLQSTDIGGLGALALLNQVNLGTTQVTGNLANNRVTGLGSLALASSVNLGTSQVTGNLANNRVAGLGALALLNQVNLSTQSTGSIPNNRVTGLGAVSVLNEINLGDPLVVVGNLVASRIAAGTLGANVIYAGEIAANKVAAGALASNVIYTGQIVATQIESGTFKSGVVYAGTLNASQLTLGNGTVGGNLRSNGGNTSTGWLLERNGNFYAANATIRGNVQATSGTIGGWNITSNGISSPNFVAGSQGARLTSQGLEVWQNGVIDTNNIASKASTDIITIYDNSAQYTGIHVDATPKSLTGVSFLPGVSMPSGASGGEIHFWFSMKGSKAAMLQCYLNFSSGGGNRHGLLIEVQEYYKTFHYVYVGDIPSGSQIRLQVRGVDLPDGAWSIPGGSMAIAYAGVKGVVVVHKR